MSKININTNLVLDTDILNQAKKYLNKYSVKDVVELIFETEKINKSLN